MTRKNTLERLADARPPALDPTGTEPSDARQARDLSAAFHQLPRREAPPQIVPRRRRGPVIALASTAVAAVTAAVIAVVLPVTSHEQGPTAGSSVPQVSASTVRPDDSPTVRAMAVRQVLLNAASVAASAPPTAGAYWHSRVVLQTTGLCRLVKGKPGGTADRCSSRDVIERWFARDPKVTSWWTQQGGGRTVSGALNYGDKVADLGGRNVSLAELQQLPTDPAALKARLLATYAGHGTEANDPMGESQWLFTIVSGLVTDMPVSGPVRAAAFRVLADLPGTRLVPVATDALGRTGTAVTLTDAPIREGAVLQSWLIIDPRTSTALAQESHVVKAGGQQAGLAAGTRWYSAAVQSSGWTDQAPPR